MTPEVWDDALVRIEAAAATVGLPVVLPNEDTDPRAAVPAPWLDIEVAAQASDPIELGGGVWEEMGSIWLHVMIPVGSGIRAGLVLRKALANAFRGVTDAAVGLSYRNGVSYDPMGPGSDDGVYRRLTLLVRYHYQDQSS